MRTVLLISVLFFTTAVSVGGAILVGRANSQPDQLQALGFGLCNGNPCYRGLTPGMTGWDKARKAATALGFEGNSAYLQLDNEVTAHWIVSIEKALSDSLPVRSIEADDPPMGERDSYAGEVIALFGPPCGIEFLAVPGTYWISYPTLPVELGNHTLDAFAPIHSILLIDPTEESDLLGHALCGQSEPNHPFEYYRWVGFASNQKYRQQLVNQYGN